MVVPPRQARRAATPFSQVKALGPHGEQAADKLATAYAELNRRGATADAQRLLAIEQAAERRDFPALERVSAGEQPLSELIAIEHKGVRRVVGMRNAVALVPLIATWFFLGWASFDYQHLLDQHPELSTEPFLVLWQQRFHGRHIPTFAETAFVAFGLLIIVLLLTIRAHALENRANAATAGVSSTVDDAIDKLALAVRTSTVRPPDTAREWAEAAQRVLSETQQMIAEVEGRTRTLLAEAVRETGMLAAENNRITATAQHAVEELHQQGRDLIAELAREIQETVVSVRDDNAQFINRTATEATDMLQQAVDSNKQLLDQQLTPLFRGFHDSLGDYRKDQEAYRASAQEMAVGVTGLTEATRVLAGSSESYTEVATSIDQHLRLIQSSQNDFVSRVTENSQSMTTAAITMREVTTLMSGNLRTDLEQLARNVVDASGRLAQIDRHLAATTSALQSVATAMDDAGRRRAAAAAAAATSAAAPRPGGILGGLFGRR
jgi:hypothetical protein